MVFYYFKIFSIFLLSIVLATIFAWMNYLMLENKLWFSNIDELEREISLRTESGLYYSYYKQLMAGRVRSSPNSIFKGIRQLTEDCLTEAPRIVNVIMRFNIFQEIFLAILYTVFEYIYDFFDQFNLTKTLLKNILPYFPTPMFFYVYACFAFAGFLVFAMFWLAVSVTQNFLIDNFDGIEWTLGVLSISWAFANLDDITRVNFSINLRENFALPMFWFQNYFILNSFYNSFNNYQVPLNNKSCKIEVNFIFTIFFTFVFSALWQFNQFLLLLQSTAILATFLIYLINASKQGETTQFQQSIQYEYQNHIRHIKNVINSVLVAQTLGFVLLIPLQKFQPMLLTSLSIQFNIAIILSINLISLNYSNSFATKLLKMAAQVLIILSFTAVFNIIINFYVGSHVDDSHIWTFLSGKVRRIFQILSLNNLSKNETYSVTELIDLPFESTVYICHGAFTFIDFGFFSRTLKTGVLPLYCISVCIVIIKALKLLFYDNKNNAKEIKPLLTIKETTGFKSCVPFLKVYDYFNNIQLTPGLLFFTLQSVLSGMLAILMLRMKYLWLPQMSVLAVCSAQFMLDKMLGKTLRKFIVISGAITLFAFRGELFKQEMAIKQEFYDPNTVELMNWILQHTHKDSIFAGSMQLMAGVKCCTNRPIANHPHFEDKWLRDRTLQIYQIYALKSLNQVHKILLNEKIDYIIVEENICFLRPNGCTITELIDLANHHYPILSPDLKLTQIKRNIQKFLDSKGFKSEKTPRFCAEVLRIGRDSVDLFKLEFINPTFRVYKIIKKLY